MLECVKNFISFFFLEKVWLCVIHFLPWFTERQKMTFIVTIVSTKKSCQAYLGQESLDDLKNSI